MIKRTFHAGKDFFFKIYIVNSIHSYLVYIVGAIDALFWTFSKVGMSWVSKPGWISSLVRCVKGKVDFACMCTLKYFIKNDSVPTYLKHWPLAS